MSSKKNCSGQSGAVFFVQRDGASFKAQEIREACQAEDVHHHAVGVADDQAVPFLHFLMGLQYDPDARGRYVFRFSLSLQTRENMIQ